jgi:hypothetical protein
MNDSNKLLAEHEKQFTLNIKLVIYLKKMFQMEA